MCKRMKEKTTREVSATRRKGRNETRKRERGVQDEGVRDDEREREDSGVDRRNA